MILPDIITWRFCLRTQREEFIRFSSSSSEESIGKERRIKLGHSNGISADTRRVFRLVSIREILNL